MAQAAMDPYGQALADYAAGDRDAAIVMHRDDGEVDTIPASVFFRGPAQFSPSERCALDLCQGHVLDIGAGAGADSLVLQARGLAVTALDVSPQAAAVMRRRGVRDVRMGDWFALPPEPFATLLLMMHGIGLVGSLAGLDRFLALAHPWLAPGGQVLCDSLAVRRTANPVHCAYHDANILAGRYVGEIRLRMEYKGTLGPWFTWLHVDPGTLAGHAARAGWRCEIPCQEEDGNYLARLTEAGTGPRPIGHSAG